MLTNPTPPWSAIDRKLPRTRNGSISFDNGGVQTRSSPEASSSALLENKELVANYAPTSRERNQKSRLQWERLPSKTQPIEAMARFQGPPVGVYDITSNNGISQARSALSTHKNARPTRMAPHLPADVAAKAQATAKRAHVLAAEADLKGRWEAFVAAMVLNDHGGSPLPFDEVMAANGLGRYVVPLAETCGCTTKDVYLSLVLPERSSSTQEGSLMCGRNWARDVHVAPGDRPTFLALAQALAAAEHEALGIDQEVGEMPTVETEAGYSQGQLRHPSRGDRRVDGEVEVTTHGEANARSRVRNPMDNKPRFLVTVNGEKKLCRKIFGLREPEAGSIFQRNAALMRSPDYVRPRYGNQVRCPDWRKTWNLDNGGKSTPSSLQPQSGSAAFFL